MSFNSLLERGSSTSVEIEHVIKICQLLWWRWAVGRGGVGWVARWSGSRFGLGAAFWFGSLAGWSGAGGVGVFLQ